MNSSEKRVFVALAALLTACVLLLYFVDSPPKSDQVSSITFTKPFLEVDDENIKSIQISYPDAPQVKIAKTSDRWDIIEPISTMADPKRIKRIISEVLNLGCGMSLPNAPETYGLNPPKWHIQMGDGQHQLVDLKIGDDAPVGQKSYALCPNVEHVQLVNALMSTTFNGGLAALRNTTLLSMLASDIQTIVFADGLEIQNQQGRWVAVSPYRSDLDSKAINRWIDNLLQARGETFSEQAFVDDGKQTLTLASREREERLSLKDKWVKSSLYADPLMASDEIQALVRTMGTNFLAKNLVLDQDKANLIEVTHNDKRIAAEKLDDTWSDSGTLYNAINQPTTRKQMPAPTEALGQLTIGYVSGAMKKYTLYGPDSDGAWWLSHSDEDVLIHAPVALLTQLGLTGDSAPNGLPATNP